MSGVPVTMPTDSNEGTQSIVGQWLKKVGESVRENEPLLEITTDKVTMEIPSPASGVLSEILKGPDTEVSPGDVLGLVTSELEAQTSPAQSARATPKAKNANESKTSSPQSTASREARSPAVAHLLRTHKITDAEISGSGAGGRVTARDVESFLANRPVRPEIPSSSGPRRINHTPMRRMIATNMVESLQRAPHVTSLFEVDLTKVIAHRERSKEEFLAREVKLTFTAYFVRACVAALHAVPEVNSRWHDDALEVIDELNIGVGTALEGPDGQAGLVVPVIHNAHDLDLFGIAAKLQELTSRARTNSLTPSEVQGGTFTISNHGVSGSLLAAPIIIPQPQSAILGIGKLEKRVVVEEVGGRDAMVIKPMAYVTLTIDHRVLDGFKANAFLTAFVNALEGGRF